MTPQNLRSKYPIFEFKSFNINSHELEFTYKVGADLTFIHKVEFENLPDTGYNLNLLAFQIGIIEGLNYWKLTCSPEIHISCGSLNPSQIEWWKKLIINGFSQYFYENQIDFTTPNFITITTSGPTHSLQTSKLTNTTLVPLGGGKDSIVTAEIVKKISAIKTVIVEPTTPASFKISDHLKISPIVVKRIFDPQLKQLNAEGFLNGHVPYSAILAFLFVYVAERSKSKYIAVSNERSSNEGNTQYLGHEVNHQYTKSLEFETDINEYISLLRSDVRYFSFLRPLYELQITKLFSKYPEYFQMFKSCNKNAKLDTWCGKCAKCISIALTLTPWVGEEVIKTIIGNNPLTDPDNVKTLNSMTTPGEVKPFECVTTTEEANICLEMITNGMTTQAQKFLTNWLENPNLPNQFSEVLKNEYEHTR